mmetsp:Transcript_14082/g.21358  ORF Transcript_14082/g.21358 Transcript_14082/m.21358 type:complete len:115 (+) Transcript_14082:44-388(+)
MFSTSVHGQIGRTMAIVGGLFIFLGFSIFDNGLLALGNTYLVIGSLVMMGPARAKETLLNTSNLKITILLVTGFLIVITGRPRIGILVESYALYSLLKSFLYTPIRILRTYLGI